MRASIYNNPLFADGLASIIETYIGNPDRERAIARDELDMQRGQLDLENQRLQNERLRQSMAGGGGGGRGDSGGLDPTRLGALFASLGQPQGNSPYSTGTPVTADFIAPSQPLSFGEAMPDAMPQAMPAPPSPMSEGLSFGEIVTEPPAPVDEYTQTKMQYDALLRNPGLALSREGQALGKLLEERMKLWEPEAPNPMDDLDLQLKELQIQKAQQDLEGGGGPGGYMDINPLDMQRLTGLLPEDMPADIKNQIVMDALQQPGNPAFNVVQGASRATLTPGTPDTNWWPWVDNSTEPSYTLRPLLDVGQPQLPNGIVRVQTEADVEALPSGTQFMTPDGKIKVKP